MAASWPVPGSPLSAAGFADSVEAAYRAMVAGFVAAEGELFNETETIA